MDVNGVSIEPLSIFAGFDLVHDASDPPRTPTAGDAAANFTTTQARQGELPSPDLAMLVNA